MDREDDSAKNTNIEDGGEEAPVTGETAILTTIRGAFKDMTTEMQELRSDITKQLSDFQNNFQTDIKKQLNELRAYINQKIEEATEKIDLTTERLEETEQRIRDMETWGTGARDAITSLLKTQHTLQAKVTELEGH